MEFKFGDVIYYDKILEKQYDRPGRRRWSHRVLSDSKRGIIIGKRVVQDGYWDHENGYFEIQNTHKTYLVAELDNMKNNPVHIKIE